MKKQLIRAAATSVLGLSLMTGFAAAGTGDISNTGASSDNTITSNTRVRETVRNDNDVSLRNTNRQNADTGDASSFQNTTGGGASTGDASNSNSLDATVSVDNSGLWGGAGAGSWWTSDPLDASINQTGFNSNNEITSNTSFTLNVRNDNDVRVTNTNTQNATSGDASVFQNTTGGDASTGDASNSNSSSFTVNVSN